MRRNNNIIKLLKKGHIAAIVAICPFMACTPNIAYHHYEPVNKEGWDKRDTMYFTVDTILQAADYTTTLCLRTNTAYPYCNFSARVTQEVRHSGKSFTRRMDFNIVRKDGTQMGKGITLFTHEVPIATQHLQPGDTLMVKVGHNMRPETLHGIEDVGIKVTRNI